MQRVLGLIPTPSDAAHMGFRPYWIHHSSPVNLGEKMFVELMSPVRSDFLLFIPGSCVMCG